MRSFHIMTTGSTDGLVMKEHDAPSPGPFQVLVGVRANSLNSRDLRYLAGAYRIPTRPGLVPLSDGAGEVLAVGPGVTRFRPGDRVVANFHQKWIAGKIERAFLGGDLGGSIDGMLSEQVVLHEEGLVSIPAHLSYEEAATLPCAAVTAWSALHGLTPLLAGQAVLTQGTGGVSLFALQFAKLAGATVIATTSSAAKAERLKAMGADAVINYRERPDWDAEVLALTAGRGVDLIVEVGGPSTMARSMRAAALGGQVVYLGILGGLGAGFDPECMRGRSLLLRTTNNGSRQAFEQMNAALAAARLRPVIDRVFEFDDARAAYRHLEAQAHVGKVVLKTG